MTKYASKAVAGMAFAFCLIISPAPTRAQSNSTAQDVPAVNGIQRGWLEGTVLNLNGQPIQQQIYQSGGGIHVRGSRRGGGSFDIPSDMSMGGLYSIQDLKPGVYDLNLQRGWTGTTGYRPQRIFGVIVKPGVRTTLNITLEEGDALQDIGQPATTEQGLLVSQELARLQQQIDTLKDQLKTIEQLRVEVEALAQMVKANMPKAAAPPASP